MKVGYTEFSYGYAFTENLIRSSATAPTGAPVFPNLQQEGKSGFDVQIDYPGAPLFFQFKLPELMTRDTASEISNYICPGLKTPFFRISMMRSDISKQHELLMSLENKYPSSVFYVAGCISNLGKFNLAYNSAAVAKKSTFFSPKDIGLLPDAKTHTIAYQPNLDTAYFCSQPRAIKALPFESLSQQISAQFEQERFESMGRTAREVRKDVVGLASPSMRQAESTIAQRIREDRQRLWDAPTRSADAEETTIDLLVAREITRVEFGVELVVAQPRT
jgi:hypothetical protein